MHLQLRWTSQRILLKRDLSDCECRPSALKASRFRSVLRNKLPLNRTRVLSTRRAKRKAARRAELSTTTGRLSLGELNGLEMIFRRFFCEWALIRFYFGLKWDTRLESPCRCCFELWFYQQSAFCSMASYRLGLQNERTMRLKCLLLFFSDSRSSSGSNCGSHSIQ